ncbi:hypothetical protein O6H91_01G147000 [Diphasiastrum complanatum]|uniref:Uncharacterized protein n=1 Tax=Diphasiastrum complanatum TaxID=34168 RepID=A0ACC2EX42_DIPCM|nr:hypothetical protein O6H91_Y274900 [Diphasiastrum complanatum]KAJ7571053.1 hypothetical protein O6H91_01G147000 [Diphasiastrum complanatum]
MILHLLLPLLESFIYCWCLLVHYEGDGRGQALEAAALDRRQLSGDLSICIRNSEVDLSLCSVIEGLFSTIFVDLGFV